MEDWQVKYQCLDCKDVIYSKKSGEYTKCKCGAIAVDQTPYYTRVIGDLDKWEEYSSDDTTQLFIDVA